ncbi:hypothetical protein BGZ60DRAFT_535455 [Tricladium varicosporioides]|nr:hypothetical protein BGZ60DRAFT_535455 [Hymenoscyphus varicosporioides]
MRIEIISSRAVTLAFISFQCIQAYILDSSCDTLELRGIIIEGMDAAMGIAQLTFDVLDRRPWKLPEDEVFSNLAKWIWKEDGLAAKVFKPTDPNLPDQSYYSLALDQARDWYADIQGVAQRVGTGDRREVRIFCTLDRLKDNNDRKRQFDPVTNVDVMWDKQDRKLCEDTEVFARTYPSAQNDVPWAIQFCPKYLAKQQKYINKKLPYLKGPINRKKFNLDRWFGYDIDAYDCFANTMLHELFHLPRGGLRIDVNDDYSYGWKNIKGMSKVASLENADSAVYFGLGVDLYSQGLIVLENGDVIKKKA